VDVLAVTAAPHESSSSSSSSSSSRSANESATEHMVLWLELLDCADYTSATPTPTPTPTLIFNANKRTDWRALSRARLCLASRAVFESTAAGGSETEVGGFATRVARGLCLGDVAELRRGVSTHAFRAATASSHGSTSAFASAGFSSSSTSSSTSSSSTPSSSSPSSSSCKQSPKLDRRQCLSIVGGERTLNVALLQPALVDGWLRGADEVGLRKCKKVDTLLTQIVTHHNAATVAATNSLRSVCC